LYKEVLAGMTESHDSSGETESSSIPLAAEEESESSLERQTVPEFISESEPTPAEDVQVEPAPIAPELEEGPVHRPLIRATLPRPEGQKDSRPLPEFTVRQAGTRSKGFRGDLRMKDRNVHSSNGNRAGGQRFAGPRQGGHGRGMPGRGPGGGFRGPQSSRRGGKKRSR
jgi:hypothetical protein